ncbi:hypothetical protein FWF93_03425, partial [Candidatus Saccharibacteria bacterium]|nr:hypothetical protein [Candidatus Saccharibacteria bacterium]
TEDNQAITNDPNDYYDFYIKGCWHNTNGSTDQYYLLVRVNTNNVSYEGGLVGSTTVPPKPPPPSYGTVKYAATGISITCGISKIDGSAWCWGINDHANLGIGVSGGLHYVPKKVSEANGFVNKDVRAIATGVHHSCAIDAEYQVWCWGKNSEGQSGTGSISANIMHPKKVVTSGALNGKYAKAISVTAYLHTCVIAGPSLENRYDDWLYCWGQGDEGELGIGNTGVPTYRTEPVAVSRGDIPEGHVFKAVDVSDNTSCGIAGLPDSPSEDWAYCWGTEGAAWIVASGGIVKTPKALMRGGVLADKTIKKISNGMENSCVIANDNRAYCWGVNSYGKLGTGNVTNSLGVVVAVKGELENRDVSEIVAGYYNTCAISSGKGYCWGANASGQIGDGTTTQKRLPTPILTTSPSQLPGTAVLTSVEIMGVHTCATDTSRTVYCWGDNAYGKLGDGTAAWEKTVHIYPRLAPSF